MAEKTLGTFRIEPEKWERFKALASSSGTSASAVILQFIDNCLDSNNILSTTEGNANLDNLESLIDARIDASLATRLDEMRSQFEAQLEELRGKSKAR